MVAASCKYPISWEFANRSSHSSFSPRSRLHGAQLFVILNREAVKNLPRIKKTKPNGRSVIAPTNIHERDSELVGAVNDRPQAVQEPKGRREESPAYQKTKPNGRSVIAPANIHERDSELVGAVIDRPQTTRKGKGQRFFVPFPAKQASRGPHYLSFRADAGNPAHRNIKT